ncbi:hypothetical protein [Lactococcus formosensis]|nr:hypothetical protein [Lactococcus formosensis]
MKRKKLRKSFRMMSIALLALGDWPVKSFEGSKGKMPESIKKYYK